MNEKIFNVLYVILSKYFAHSPQNSIKSKSRLNISFGANKVRPEEIAISTLNWPNFVSLLNFLGTHSITFCKDEKRVEKNTLGIQ